jgi:hypothetical protein
VLKEISEVYQNFSAGLANQTMTGTAQLISAVTNIKYKDSVAIQLKWTGTPTGTFTVDGSLDYNPGLPQSGAPPGGANNGTWTSLVLSPAPVASGAAGNILLNLNQLAFPWIRVTYTNASGTGTLTGYISAKSLG